MTLDKRTVLIYAGCLGLIPASAEMERVLVSLWEEGLVSIDESGGVALYKRTPGGDLYLGTSEDEDNGV